MRKGDIRSIEELANDIVEWGNTIPGLMDSLDFESFQKDHRTHLAVWKCVEVVGEAAGLLLKQGFASEDVELREELRLAKDMRNRLTHGYPGVDLNVLWNTARKFVPQLVTKVRAQIERTDDKD
jgi:uncharacterized protein with HEPN domain